MQPSAGHHSFLYWIVFIHFYSASLKDLPKVLTWWLEWDSNLRPSGWKAPNPTTEPPRPTKSLRNKTAASRMNLRQSKSECHEQFIISVIKILDYSVLLQETAMVIVNKHAQHRSKSSALPVRIGDQTSNRRKVLRCIRKCRNWGGERASNYR